MGTGHALLPVMRFAWIVITAACLAVCIYVPSEAHGNGYVSFGVGLDTGVRGDIDSHVSQDTSTTARLALGHRNGALGVELVAAGTDFGDSQGPGEASWLSLGVDVKYHVPLGTHFEAYARGGWHRGWLGSNMSAESGREVIAGRLRSNYSGNGYAVGAGLQYNLSFGPLMNASIWTDYGRNLFDLGSEDDGDLGGSSDTLSLGVLLHI